MAPAQDQLLGLGEEFDLADAAAPQLDIVAGDRDLAMADMGMNLALDGMNVLDGGEIQIAPPDEGRDRRPGTAAPVSGSPAQARALIMAARSQFWPMAFIIIQRRVGGDRHLGGAGIGPQPQIDAEDIAVAAWSRRSA